MTRIGRWLVLAAALLAGGDVRAQCRGDFNLDGSVTIDELVSAVESALSGCDSGGPRFIDNGDGTISDTHTGLMWEKKVGLDGTARPNELHDADNEYQWAGRCLPSTEERFCQPTSVATAECPTGAVGCDACPDGQTCEVEAAGGTVFEWIAELNVTAFAGHSDWRVPTLSELLGLTDRGRANPAIDQLFSAAGCGADCVDLNDPDCNCTAPLFYWSETSVVAGRPRAWTVRFDIGAVDGGGLDFDILARAVRSGP